MRHNEVRGLSPLNVCSHPTGEAGGLTQCRNASLPFQSHRIRFVQLHRRAGDIVSDGPTGGASGGLVGASEDAGEPRSKDLVLGVQPE